MLHHDGVSIFPDVARQHSKKPCATQYRRTSADPVSKARLPMLDACPRDAILDPPTFITESVTPARSRGREPRVHAGIGEETV